MKLEEGWDRGYDLRIRISTAFSLYSILFGDGEFKLIANKYT